ncbi:unnamed protein product, partial [marine sediment metagenome]
PLLEFARSLPSQELQTSLGSVPFIKISLIFPGQKEPTNIPDWGQT